MAIMQRSIVSAVLLIVLSTMVVFGQSKPDLIIFDEDDAVGSGYYDSSWGTKSGSSTLLLGGPSSDKLVIDNVHSSRGTQSGILQWRSVSGGNWKIFIASPGWSARDASGYDSLVFHLNGPGAIAAANLPGVGLESATNISTPMLLVGTYLPAGVDGDTTTWQRVAIPTSAFNTSGGFLFSNFKDINFGQAATNNVQHTLWVDDIRFVTKPDTTLPPAPTGVVIRSGDRSIVLHWDWLTASSVAGYHLYRSTTRTGGYTKITPTPLVQMTHADLTVSNGQAYYYYVRAANGSDVEGPASDTVEATPAAFANDQEFLDYLQRTAIDFFWYEANPANGLVRDRSSVGSASSIASVGFGLTAISIGAERGWIPRTTVRDRVLTTLKTFWTKPQGTATTGTIGYKGFFYHFLNMNTATRSGTSELSSIDTGLLLAGILYAQKYFDGADSLETEIRALADSIYRRMDWLWMRNGQTSLTMGWQPESGFLSARWVGYNEAMILYILGMGAPTNALPSNAWTAWTNGYINNWHSYYGQTFITFPPLFGHQYSHCWIDFRSIADDVCRSRSITYAENSRRATLAQQAYCVANPAGRTGYSSLVWGLTACDGPGTGGAFGYIARGAPPAWSDDGTIAPTAAGGSLPFAPEICLPTLRHFYDQYRAKIWTGYGFRDAFHLGLDWWDPDIIGIDQGPIAIMAENYRSESVWDRFMDIPAIQQGLTAAGFTPVTDVAEDAPSVVATFALHQNYPNPFNPETHIRFDVGEAGPVMLRVYDLTGRLIRTLAEGEYRPGSYEVVFDGIGLSSGVYFYELRAGSFVARKSLIAIK